MPFETNEPVGIGPVIIHGTPRTNERAGAAAFAYTSRLALPEGFVASAGVMMSLSSSRVRRPPAVALLMKIVIAPSGHTRSIATRRSTSSPASSLPFAIAIQHPTERHKHHKLNRFRNH